MLTSNRYLINGSSIHCMFCGEPFRPRDGYVEFWRSSTGHHFCSEFCADDAEEERWPRLSEQFLRIDKWSVCRG